MNRNISDNIKLYFGIVTVLVVIMLAQNTVFRHMIGYNIELTNWIMVSFIILSSVTIAWDTYKKLKEVNKLMFAVEELVNGNIDVHIDYRFDKTDDINNLAINATKLRDTLKRMIKDIDNMSILHSMGKIDRVIDARTYTGSYSALANNVSKMGQEYAKMTKEVSEALVCMANGNFEIKVEQYEGEKAKISESLSLLNDNLRIVNGEIKSMIGYVQAGELSQNFDTEGLQGEWKEQTLGFQALLNEIKRPIDEAKEVLKKVSEGDLSAKMEGFYNGEFLEIKRSINESNKRIKDYIDEISGVLGEVAKDNLDTKIHSYFYGDFYEIKEDVNSIVKKFSDVISQIKTSSGNTNQFASDIANNSNVVADGAREQNEYITSLKGSISRVNEGANQNSENSQSALSNSDKLKASALEATEQMNNMLISMESIKQSSEDISGIVKIVEGITLQTNLLAINATIEAAKAGEAGRGFAVVGEEVRSLSQRVSSATNDIRNLVEESIRRVQHGNDIAEQTDVALKEIVEKAALVSENIDLIQNSSKSQVRDIVMVSDEVTKIADVVNVNSERTVHLAQSSQELEGIAVELAQMTQAFNVK